MARQARETKLLVHPDAFMLMRNFLRIKQQLVNEIEKRVDLSMDIFDCVARLLSKRPLINFGNDEMTALKLDNGSIDNESMETCVSKVRAALQPAGAEWSRVGTSDQLNLLL